MNEGEIRTDLEIITGAEKAPEGETLSHALARLDAIARDPDLPERLEHYLSKRSYVKALEWLDNPDMPHRK